MRYERGGRGSYRPQNAPVKVGDELDVKIEAVGEKGDGVAKKDGFVLFVPNTKQGDEVKIKVTRVLQKVGFAEVVGDKSDQEESTGAEEAQEEEGYEETSNKTESQESDEEYKGKDTEDFGENADE